MFVTDSMIGEMEDLYGIPSRISFDVPVTEDECGRIKSSQKHGRNHDVTMYIVKADKIIVIAKHMYPPKLFRAPSGGLKPGEDFETGAQREALEETGCSIRLEKFLVRTDVVFKTDNDRLSRSDRLEWRSFVFQARYIAGEFFFTDRDEIREVTLATLTDFEEFSTIMRSTTIGGLHYRASLHDVVKPLLELSS